MNRKSRLLAALFIALAPFSYAETWTFNAAQVTSVQRDDQSKTVLDGDVQVNSEKLEIHADHIELTGPDYDVLTGKGSIFLRELEKGITIEANRIDYDKNKELIKLRGFVTLMDEEDEIVIRCESMDFYQKEEIVILQVAVRLINDKTVGRGEFATYRREEKILELSGRPVVWQENDKYQADRIIVNLDTDEISMEGEVQGILTTEGEEAEKETGEETGEETDVPEEEAIDDGADPADDESLWK